MDTVKSEEFSFQAEMDQLLHLLINSLYTHKEIFLRELISNASDALHKIRFIGLTEKEYLDHEKELKIEITVDDKAKTILIKDYGIGMTRDELINNIGTLARSGTLKFLTEIQQKDEKKNSDLIGQFGVGFYSVFMVAQEVSVKTRSYTKDSKGYEWKSSGTNKYTISEISKEDRGTEILIKLKKDDENFASEFELKQIIQKYSNFVDFPVFVGADQANKSAAVWRKQASQVTEEERKEFYKFISHDFQDPMGHIHLNAEAPIAYSSLLFIPSQQSHDIFQKPDEFHIHLYVKKVFIQNDCKELLPQYLRFVKGVVDSEDLDLNVSREVTQHSPVLAKIKKTLTGKILKLIEGWAEKDSEKYKKFYQNFSRYLKEGIESDYENRDKIIELLRFETSTTAESESISFAEYLKRMKSDQNDIYYLSGKSKTQMMNNPNLEYFKESGIEVLLLDDIIDDYLMPIIGKYQEKNIVNIEKSDINIKEKEDTSGIAEEQKKNLLEAIKKVLGDNLEDVKESKRLAKSPCSLVNSNAGMNSHMEQMMKMMNPDFKAAKKILEINFSSPIIKKMVNLIPGEADSEKFKSASNALYEAAQLLENRLSEPSDFVNRFFDYMLTSLEK